MTTYWGFALVGALAFAAVASAGELSDTVCFGDKASEKAHAVVGVGTDEVMSARIGTVDERIPCWTSGPRAGDTVEVTLRKQPGKPFSIQVQEVYPPDAPDTRYTYSVYANDKLVYVRDNLALMFGVTSYFVHIDDPALVKSASVKLRFANSHPLLGGDIMSPPNKGGEGSPFRLSTVWLYSDLPAYCRESGFAVPMYMTPLLGGSRDDSEIEKEFKYLSETVKPTGGKDIKLGCAAEYHYMRDDALKARERFDQLLKFSMKYDMPIELAFVSWWGGTPMWMDDGQGGKLSDVKYQQVCWSETDTYDDGPELKKLLGDKYDLRYGLTVPNRWSSTPWLTMNSPVLNGMRYKRIGEKLAALADLVSDPAYPNYRKYLLAVGTENEPRYWDYHCPDEKYPVKREKLWADFNPCTVADAAKDGVTLDPKDGLDYKERLWLHGNVATYQQGTYDAHAGAIKQSKLPFINSPTDRLWHEVYSHGFGSPVFPMDEVTKYHPGLEWNRLHGCRTGIEDVPSPAVSYLSAAREWGRWSQVNYEENNGKGTEWHVRTLRACYAYGARFYTFYNWQSINKEGRWAEYVRKFCADAPEQMVVERHESDGLSYVTGKTHAFTVDTPPDWPAFNAIDMTVTKPGEYVLRVYDSPEKTRLLGYRSKYVPQLGAIDFDLPNCVPLDDRRQVYITVTRTDGREFGLLMNPGDQWIGTLRCDSARERAQSLLVCWRADAEALIDDLTKQCTKGLETARKFYDAGSYRKAYETAAKLEAP